MTETVLVEMPADLARRVGMTRFATHSQHDVRAQCDQLEVARYCYDAVEAMIPRNTPGAPPACPPAPKGRVLAYKRQDTIL